MAANENSATTNPASGVVHFNLFADGARQLWATPLRLFAASGCWLAALAWARPLSSPDETRYTDIPRWMVESGDWLVPRINGLPFVHKPPLYFWIEAAFLRVFGITTFVARLPSLCAALLLCACVHSLVRDFKSDRAARWSAGVLLFNPLFYGGAQYANLDMLVASLITATITCAVLATRCGPKEGRKERILWIGAYAAAALGLLAKGLIGFVLPGLIFVLYSALSGRWSFLWRAISIPGLVLFAGIALPWFVLMERKLPGFAQHFFVFQHFTRYTTMGFNNQHGIWFYPAVLFVAMLPWTFASRGLWPALVRNRSARADPDGLALIWLLVTAVFFSIPASKVAGYIFPALPAFAILAGPWIAERTDRYINLAIGASLCVAAVAVAVMVQPQGMAPAVAQIRDQVSAADKVVFYKDYHFDAALALDRAQPSYVLGNWSRRSVEMNDNVARQLTEGREFDAQSGNVLISEIEFRNLVREPGRLWVVLHQKPGLELPDLFNGFAVAATSSDAMVLRKER